MNKPSAIETAQIAVTPALAVAWLARNTNNRPILQKRVESFAAEMRAGTFELTNDCLGFDAFGNLINGQHRLSAVVASGCTVPFLVVRGLPPEARNVIDTGAKRSVADVLHFTEGMQHAARITSICGVLIMVEHRRTSSFSVAAIKAMHAKWAGEIGWVLDHAGSSRQFFTTGPVLGAVVVGHRASAEDTAEFWHLLTTGASIPEECGSLLALRTAGLAGKFAKAGRVATFFTVCNVLADFCTHTRRARLSDKDNGYCQLMALGTPATPAAEGSA